MHLSQVINNQIIYYELVQGSQILREAFKCD